MDVWPEWLGLTVLISAYSVLLLTILCWYLFSCYFFAFIVSTLMRIYFRLRMKSENYFYVGIELIKIYIESLSLALLGGKLFFRKLQYTTRNASLYIEEGYITLSWWFLLKPNWKNCMGLCVNSSWFRSEGFNVSQWSRVYNIQ